jgi:hypothetical protein
VAKRLTTGDGVPAAAGGAVLTLLAEGAPLTAVTGHLGDTVETVGRVYAHWLRDDREVPADVRDRVLAPADARRARDTASDADA